VGVVEEVPSLVGLLPPDVLENLVVTREIYISFSVVIKSIL
jgi:hypothetical protein